MLTEISGGRKVPEIFPVERSLIKQVSAIVGRCARGCTVKLYPDLRDAFFAEKRSVHEEALVFANRSHLAGELSGDEFRSRVMCTLSSNV